MAASFLIDNRFLIDPSRHLLQDVNLNAQSRLEPRLVKLLCLLCEQEGKLVTRSFLVREVWHDYAGGDEALNQAISLLRKMLGDAQKDLIKTIPKKGYVLQATVNTQPLNRPVVADKPLQKQGGYRLSAALFVLLLVVLLRIYQLTYLDKPDKQDETLVPTSHPLRQDAAQHTSAPADKHTSPPPEGKDDARITTTNK